jgi:hypothetical protein
MPNIRDIVNGEFLVSWGRYLYWAELMRRDWDAFMTEKGAGANMPIPEWLGVTCYWAASLYVVIEGWEAARFKDPIIDVLLGISNYKDVLRKLRNGTFHYQPELVSPKVTGVLESFEVNLWLHFLHEEFCRWLRDVVETVGQAARLSPEQLEEWREELPDIVGWLPLRPAEEEMKALRKKFDDIEKELDASGSTSKEALDLRASLSLYDVAVKKTAESVREDRRDMLAKFGLNPDDFIP